MKPTKLFHGGSNPDLARKLALEMEIPLGSVDISKFLNDETRLQVTDTDVDGRVAVLQSFSKPVDSHIIEFGFLCDALYRLGATDIVGIIPWLAYSKQDKVFRPGEPLSVKVIAKMLQVVPVRKIYTFDLHNLAILGFFDVPLINLSARPLFVDYFRKSVAERSVVVAPDAGAVKASTQFATELGAQVAYVDKKRDLATGKVTVAGLSRSVKNCDILIIDDMIVTGDTLIETASYLKSQGAGKISVGATHHLYVPGAQERMDKSAIDEIVVTDTIGAKTASPKLTVLSVSGLLSRELNH